MSTVLLQVVMKCSYINVMIVLVNPVNLNTDDIYLIVGFNNEGRFVT